MATVWLAGSFFPPLSAPTSETDRYYHFARTLIARGHDVVMLVTDIDRWEGRGESLTEGEKFRDEFADHLTVRVFRTRPFQTVTQRLISMLDFERLILTNHRDLPPPDIVMGATLPPFTAHAAQVLAGRYRVPFLLEMGDIWPETLVEMGELSRWHPGFWLLRGLKIRLYRKAARILSKLPMGKDHVEKSHADPGKVVWLPNGVLLDPYLDGSYPLAPPDGGDFTLVYAGGLTPAYGVHHIVDAARIVASQAPDLPIRFQLRGAGNLRSELIDYAREAGAENVSFPERVPQAQVPAMLSEADAFITIIRDLEVIRRYGMSANKIYEYMGAARPIIFSVASANDPVAEAGAGITVEPEDPQAIADAAIRLYRMGPEERLELSRRARDYVVNGFSMDQIAVRFARIVEEVLAGLPPGTSVDRDDVRA